MKQGINVLSLFDGMSCGQIALDRLGIPVNRYLASEIDKYAIEVASFNYPFTEHIGDVTKVDANDLPEIDLLIGGSPCQGFSFAGKQLNFKDPRSKLFFEFVRLWEDTMPKYFFLENVNMKKEYQDVISNILGVQPIDINSNLVSAQNRRRLYWTNIPFDAPPEDRGIMLKDIIHEFYEGENTLMREKSCTLRVGGRNSPMGSRQDWDSVYNKNKISDLKFNVNPSGKGINGNVYSILRDKSSTLTTNKGEGQKVAVDLSAYLVPFDKTLQLLDKEVGRGKVKRHTNNKGTVYTIHGEKFLQTNSRIVPLDAHNSPEGLICLAGIETKSGKRWGDNKNLQRNFSQGNRVYSPEGKAPALAAQAGGYSSGASLVFGCIAPDRINKGRNGQRFNTGRKFYTLTTQDKHGILIEGYIRKLTPVECERLQTVPDGYTARVSNTQRYKMLGNGWTVDVIAHFFKNMKF